MISFSVQTDEALRHMQEMVENSGKVNGEILALGREYSGHIANFAPKKTGWMALNASEIVQQNGADSVTVGVGPFSKLGYPTDSAMPKGQIASFISRHKKLRGHVPSSPRGAWWALAKEGKDKLLEERTGRKPRYWQAIEEQQVPDRDGGILDTTPFISMANNAIQSAIRRIENLLK